MLEQILQSLLIIVAIGLMLLVLYQIVKVSGALFLIGLISHAKRMKKLLFSE
ncbi:TPA: hypothetical protein U9C26_002165, partial [Streptococcus agalactiae]|nr:hypothetical protein [Streptococcus agalactiae]